MNLFPFDIKLETKRQDLTDLYSFSIDPEGAHEIDDAISIEKGFMNTRFGIHIADVAFQVDIGSNEDKKARFLNKSIFEPDYVPMFSEDLVEKLSFSEGKDRLGLSILFDVKKKGKISKIQIVPTKINVDRNISYDYATNIPKDDYLLHKNVNNLEILLDSLSFDWSNFNPKKLNSNILKGHNLVEMTMFLCNYIVPTFLSREGVFYVRRAFYERGTQLPRLNPLISHLVENGRAFYTLGPHPHQALNIDKYTHFTSPIRRYPDISVHRQTWAIINGNSYLSKSSLLKEVENANKVISDELVMA